MRQGPLLAVEILGLYRRAGARRVPAPSRGRDFGFRMRVNARVTLSTARMLGSSAGCEREVMSLAGAVASSNAGVNPNANSRDGRSYGERHLLISKQALNNQ